MHVPTCLIAVCAKGQKQRIKRALALHPDVTRVTDHGSHLKINTRGEPLIRIPGMRAMRVADETTHWDAEYWDYAMAAFRRATTEKQPDRKALRVMIHYLCNLFGVSEAQFLERLARRRRKVDAKWTPKKAHGWELQYVAKLRRKR